MKEKYVIFCFIKLNAKISPKYSVEAWLFCPEVYVSSFKVYIYLFTLFPAETAAMK